jgi:bifunctional enzyme CysN/CysC
LLSGRISTFLPLRMSATATEQSLLRLVTCGSVDDGKSTLIGRLLYDAKGIFEDQLASVKQASGRYGTTGGGLDLALLTDGLKAEREQGITIDVAYRYFSTPRRDFIIADSPGHEEYTRNMATGASTADLAILLIDARHGVVTQTRRHAFIVSLLGIRHVVLAVNKMDLMKWDRGVVEKIERDFAEVNKTVGLKSIALIPMSALNGDNVTHKSDATPWYDGPTLLEHLETVVLDDDAPRQPLRFPVQLVTRPNLNFRGYMGTIAAGVVKPGDAIVVLPANTKAVVKEVFDADGAVESLEANRAATITLDRELDASRGDTIASAEKPPTVASRIRAHVVWFSHEPMTVQKPYRIKHAARHANATVTRIVHRIDVNTLDTQPANQLAMNDIAVVEIEAARPLVFDPYAVNRVTGSFILIDRVTGATVGAGMIEGAAEVHANRAAAGPVTARERATRFKQRPAMVAITGDAENAKAVAAALDRQLFAAGHLAAIVEVVAPGVLSTMASLGAISIVLGDEAGAHVARNITSDEDPDATARAIFEALEAANQLTSEPDFDI